MKFKGIFVLIFFVINSLSAQYVNIGASSVAMARSDMAIPSLWSASSNQAALPYLENKYSVGLNFENYFFMKELSLKSLTFIYNSEKYGTFDFLINSFGFSEYNENFFGLGYSMKLADFLSAGIQMDFVHYHQPQPYKNLNFVIGEISLYSKLTDDIALGFHLYNPWLAKIRISGGEYFPTIAELGAYYHMADKVDFSLALNKELTKPLSFKTGLQYRLIDNLYLRTGIAFSQNDYFIGFGIGYTYKFLTLNIGFEQHPVLGLRSGVSLIVTF